MRQSWKKSTIHVQVTVGCGMWCFAILLVQHVCTKTELLPEQHPEQHTPSADEAERCFIRVRVQTVTWAQVYREDKCSQHILFYLRFTTTTKCVQNHLNKIRFSLENPVMQTSQCLKTSLKVQLKITRFLLLYIYFKLNIQLSSGINQCWKTIHIYTLKPNTNI